MAGVEVNKIDMDSQILYLTLPERSEEYNTKNIKCAADYEKSIKETWIGFGIFSSDCTVKYKTKDIYWTREMGEKNYNDNQDNIFNLTFK